MAYDRRLFGGPGLRGGGIRWGMRAEEGAIEKVTIDPRTLAPAFETVAGAAPRGIRASGMIDLISEMMVAGILDPGGRYRLDAGHPRMVTVNEEKAYVIVSADQTAIGEDILLTEYGYLRRSSSERSRRMNIAPFETIGVGVGIGIGIGDV